MKLTDISDEHKKRYQKNYQMAKEHKPQIAKMLDFEDLQIDSKLIVYETPSGETGLSYETEQGPIQITGSEKPSRTAQEIIELQLEADREALDRYTHGLLFIMDPYLLMAIFKTLPWYRHLYSIFPNGDYVYTLFHLFDFTDAIKYSAFKPIFHNDKDQLEISFYLLLGNGDYLTNGLKYLVYHPVDKLYGKTLDRLLKLVPEITLTKQSNIGTSLMLGEWMMENDLRNLDKFLRYPDIGILKGKLENKPIVCVAAGPSLKTNIEYLAEIKNEVYIIAVSAALKPLLAHGIDPDLITTLDMSKEVVKYLRGVDVENRTIVTEMSGHYSIMQEIPSNYIISVASTINKPYLEKFLSILGVEFSKDARIGGAMTVAFMSVQLAHRMGASEIILLGQDLAYEGATHVDGADYTAGVKIVNKNGRDYFMFDELGGAKDVVQPVDYVKGYYKETVPTTTQFVAYIGFLNRMIQGKKLKVVNCTEGGAFIENAEQMTLKECYETYIKPNPLETRELNLPKTRDYDFGQLPGKISKLDDQIKTFEQVLDLVKEGLTELEQYEALRKKGLLTHEEDQEMGRLGNQVNAKVKILLNDHKSEIDYVAMNSPAGFYLFKFIENANATGHSEEDIVVDMKNRAILLFSAVEEGMKIFIAELSGVRERIEQEYSEYLL